MIELASPKMHAVTPEPQVKAISFSINIFDKNEIDNDKDIAFTCGSGVTACILGLANSIISGKKPTIYDGSWSEYGLE